MMPHRVNDLLNFVIFTVLSICLIHYSSDSGHVGNRSKAVPTMQSHEELKSAAAMDILSESLSTKPESIGVGKAPKILLMWNTVFGEEFGQEMLGGCPSYNCKITNDKSQFRQSSAVIFHDYSSVDEEQEYARSRAPWQRFVYFVQESPLHTYVSLDSSVRNFYNWTFTYRRDSDIPSPYGYTVKLENAIELPSHLVDVIQNKKHLAAWFVSNCGAPSQRLPYVQKLQQYMPVHIYGACGNYSCPPQSGNCSDLISSDYKFYFAFENSICKDYVTEKFWSLGSVFVVPVVLKRSIVEPFAPPNSFIAVDDFNNPQELAAYLQKLDENIDLYTKYFEWRRQYRIVYLNGVTHDFNERPWGFCLLCKRLWQDSEAASASIDNLHDWWVKNAQCSSDVTSLQLKQSFNEDRKATA